MGRTAAAIAILILASGVTLAQASPDFWENLGQLRPGEKIAVVDKDLKSIEGSFTGYSSDALSLRTGAGEIAMPRAQVLTVKRRGATHRRRNVLIGMAAGAAGGLLAGAIRGATYHEAGETPVFVAVYTPIGAGIGAAFGAVLPAGEITVYRARSRN